MIYFILISIIAIGVFCYVKGKEKVKLTKAKIDLEAVEDANKVSDDIDNLDNDDVNKRLSKWTR